jgi:PAS domain-containing protein
MGKPLQDMMEPAVIAEGYLQVALDNMPGALVYTDEDLNIVFCNNRFKDMYPVPIELLSPGEPYIRFLRYLATHGYYGKGDVEDLLARRIESLRNPTGKSFDDITPDGRCYRIYRRRAASGGTVTVMADVTEQKRAEQELASKEAQLHVALDHMPGALVYTDEDLNIVFCNEESMKALVGLAHMTKQYDPEQIKKLAPAFAFLSTANPGSLSSIERAAGYARPDGRALARHRIDARRGDLDQVRYLAASDGATRDAGVGLSVQESLRGA